MLDRPQNKHLKPVKPGEVRNPAGRPKGSRNKLSDAFLQALADDFEAHGKGVVEKVRTERPQDYLKIVASVMPKRMEVELIHRAELLIYPMTSLQRLWIGPS
jgi:hypothetical protein